MSDSKKAVFKTPSKRKKGFLIFYLIFILVLAVLGFAAVNYVSAVLVEYEAAQPDKMAMDCAEEIHNAAKEKRLDKVLSFAAVKREIEISDEEYERFQQEIANGTLTVKKFSEADEGKNVLCYNILLNDGSTVAKYKIKSMGQETKLAIFPIEKWKQQSLEATMYSEEFSLPSSVTVILNGEMAIGTPSEDGKTVYYRLCSITEPDIVISDVLGNSVPYSNEGKYSFKQYKLTVPSNFTVMGKEPVSPTSEEKTPMEELNRIYDLFPDLPVLYSYDLIVMENKDHSLTVLDNNGQNVDISEKGDVISITSLSSSDAVSDKIENPPDPLEIAKQWSLFMTKDLNGDRYGFYTMAKYLFKDSDMYNRAWEWATGPDIAYTSLHTLAYPPFTKEEVKNYITYSDKCFSCEIFLEKPLYLDVGSTAIDTIHSVFYFGLMDDTDNGIDDPHWGIIDAVSVFE
ncbi:MAG: hypothetical protein K2J79_00780 [Ruminiclostridium sp.]|nr:hypothetical protein [Ruminiclostridium sp.]